MSIEKKFSWLGPLSHVPWCGVCRLLKRKNMKVNQEEEDYKYEEEDMPSADPDDKVAVNEVSGENAPSDASLMPRKVSLEVEGGGSGGGLPLMTTNASIHHTDTRHSKSSYLATSGEWAWYW